MLTSTPFDQVVRTHRQTAYRMALHISHGNQEEADDMVQEVFIKMWRTWDHDRPRHLKSWMYRSLRNLYIDHCRQAGRRPTVSMDEPQNPLREESPETLVDFYRDERPGPHQWTASRDVQRHVTVALMALPGEFRMPLVLCDLDGLPYHEIARRLACPIGTVRSRIHRGRLLLQRSLGHLRWTVTLSAMMLMAGAWLYWMLQTSSVPRANVQLARPAAAAPAPVIPRVAMHRDQEPEPDGQIH